jgi:hypothetical protein
MNLTRREALGAAAVVAASVGTPAMPRPVNTKSAFLWGVATAGHQIEAITSTATIG